MTDTKKRSTLGYKQEVFDVSQTQELHKRIQN